MNHQEQIEITVAIDDKMDVSKEQFLESTELKQDIDELSRMAENLPI
jgi:hypothetical protein